MKKHEYLIGIVLFLSFTFSTTVYSTQIESSTSVDIGLKTQTVIADGVGSDVESASQNAAENALMQVVGTFIDAQKQLDKRTEIKDGIRSQTKSISTNIKEYSQGTIKGFKVVDSHQEGSLTRLTAEVVIRIDDFHAYIKKLAEGEVAVDEGVFVKMQNETKQNSNQSSLLFDNVISPIVNGEVIEFSVEEPRLLSETEYKDQTGKIGQLSKEYGNIIVLKINASLNKNFSQNMRKTIESIASQKITFNTSPQSIGTDAYMKIGDFKNYNYLDDTVIFLHSGNSVVSDTLNDKILFEGYLFNGSKQELIKKAEWLNLHSFAYVAPTTNLEISMLSSKGDVLQKEMYGKVSTNKLFVDKDDYANNDSFQNPWSFLGITQERGDHLMIWENRSFIAYIAVDPAAMAKTKKILVKLVK